MSRLALITALTLLAGCSSTGWRAQKIDASSAATFEKSVASLQESLPTRRRQEFEVALAVIWMRGAIVGAGDVDSNGSVDVNEVRALQRLSEDVLKDVKRGVLVSAVRERGDNPASYLQQLHGSSYADVLNLADATDGTFVISAVRRREMQARCRERIKSALVSRFCARQ